MKNFNLKSAVFCGILMTTFFVAKSLITHDYVMKSFMENDNVTTMTIIKTIGAGVLRGVLLGILMGFIFKPKSSNAVAQQNQQTIN